MLTHLLPLLFGGLLSSRRWEARKPCMSSTYIAQHTSHIAVICLTEGLWSRRLLSVRNDSREIVEQEPLPGHVHQAMLGQRAANSIFCGCSPGHVGTGMAEAAE